MPETRVTVDGNTATLQDVEQGAEVRASYQVKEGGPVAVTIAVGDGNSDSKKGGSR